MTNTKQQERQMVEEKSRMYDMLIYDLCHKTSEEIHKTRAACISQKKAIASKLVETVQKTFTECTIHMDCSDFSHESDEHIVAFAIEHGKYYTHAEIVYDLVHGSDTKASRYKSVNTDSDIEIHWEDDDVHVYQVNHPSWPREFYQRGDYVYTDIDPYKEQYILEGVVCHEPIDQWFETYCKEFDIQSSDEEDDMLMHVQRIDAEYAC